MYIKDKDGNYVPTPSSKGADGREVSLRVANNYIQWRYPDTEWTNLVPLSDLKGEPGTDGIDGREVHMRVVSDTLQWRLGDSGTWQTLMSLSTVTDGAAFGGMVVDKTLVLAEMEAGGGGGGTADAVTYTPQTLTEEQQEQARTNIGAGQPLFVVNVTTTLSEQGEEVYTADKTSAEIETAYQEGCEIVCRMSVPIIGMGLVPVQLPLASRRGHQIFMFAINQTMWTDKSSRIVSYLVTIADDGVNVGQNNTEIYIKPTSGIPKTDLEQSVQTSLDKADTAISLGLTSATPGQIIKVKAVQDGKPTEWEAVDMPSGDKWEKVADIELRADTALYVLADFAVWRKAKVIMRRPTYISGLKKNVWCHVAKKNDEAGSYYSCGYLTLEYGYTYWDFSAEVSNSVISSTTLRSNNIQVSQNVLSTQTLTPLDLPPTDYVFTLKFTDTSVIQDSDKVTVIGVRR